MKTALRFGLVLTTTLWAGHEAMAAEQAAATCPFAGQKPLLAVHIFMGQSLPKGGTVTAQQWNEFLRKTVTPAFPEGLTVYSTYGQYQNPTTKVITREPSKDVFVDGVDTANLRSRVTKVVDAWKKQYKQQSVGIVTSTECMAF
jgi:hypothetical protein